MKPYKFFIHSVIHALSHRKGGYDVMKDYQMCMVTALVLNKKYNFSRIVFHYMKDNITSGSKGWVYPRFVQMMLDHPYPNLVKDEQNDLMVLHHMDSETLIRLSKYTKNWPEPKKTEFFGYIKDDKYEDPDPVNHLKWRNDAEMKEKSAIDELTKLEEFCETRNDWYMKEENEKKKKGGKRTPKAQTEEGSSSQPQKKRRKKVVETLLVDEPEEDETEVNVEKYQQQLSHETEQLMRDIDDTLEVGKSVSQKVVDDKEKSLFGSEDEIHAEVERWIQENFDPRNREKPKKRKRVLGDDDDETYVPQENVQVVTPLSSGGRKKSTSRKRVKSPGVRKLKFKIKINPPAEPQSKPPSPPPPPQKPSRDSLHIHQSPPQHHTLSPIHEQPPITSPLIQQTPPTTQPPFDTTPGSSGFTIFPPIPEDITLEKLDDFSFVNDDLVKKLQKKVDEVSNEKKKLEKRVETDQVEIDILKVRIAVLEEEKARRDEWNEYFKLKNKELEAKNARKEHREYLMKKVLEDLIGKPVKQRFEEIELAEVRAKREAEIEAQMKDKGKNVQFEDVKAGGEGEHGNAENVDENVDKSTGLILHLEHDVEEAEIFHTYTRDEIVKMMVIEDSEFYFGFEEELNKFDINHQPKYQYKYVGEADNYDKVKVEDWSDDDQSENVNVDTSSFPTLVELFSQANEDELRRKVAESVQNKSFQEMSKDQQRKE
ncbi:hypothetical protein Hanom_Chr01g00038241 [Helianthus anomalus]